MRVYLDSSALLKRVIEEPESEHTLFRTLWSSGGDGSSQGLWSGRPLGQEIG